MITERIRTSKGFYVGDPCLVLSDEAMDAWERNDYKEGAYDMWTGARPEAVRFAATEIKQGDGGYDYETSGLSLDRFGLGRFGEFSVDSGTLGVVALESCDPDKLRENADAGQIIKCSEDEEYAGYVRSDGYTADLVINSFAGCAEPVDIMFTAMLEYDNR